MKNKTAQYCDNRSAQKYLRENIKRAETNKKKSYILQQMTAVHKAKNLKDIFSDLFKM